MVKSSSYNWNENTFWSSITNRKHRIEKATLSGIACTYEPETGAWRQACSANGSTLPALLQNPYVVVDATDHGLGIYPLPLGGRYFVRPSFTVQLGDFSWNTHPQRETKRETDGFRRNFLLAPGAGILTGDRADGLQYRVCTYLPASFPFILVELALRGCDVDQQVRVIPELLWMPGQRTEQDRGNIIWLQPQEAPVFDEMVCRNNSTAADPQRPNLPVTAGIGLALENPSTALIFQQTGAPAGSGPLVVGDQLFQFDEFQRLQFSAVEPDKTDDGLRLTLILGVCETPESFAEYLEKWRAMKRSAQEQERQYWTNLTSRLTFSSPDPAVDRQVPFSVHNSLFSRSFTDDGRTIFIHGRRDRGYGDCSKIHQSYQMYFPALAAGESESVREELLAFAALQDTRGDLARQPRPGSGWHPYIGLYSTANYLLAVYRYLAWTGDFTLLDEVVESKVEPGDRQTVLDRLVRGAEWLLSNRWQGLIAPCGWVDAWPAGVKSQSQISIATYMALDQLAQIFGRLGHDDAMNRYWAEAEVLRERIMAVYYNPETGLFGEYLFEDGSVAGDQVDDFWSVTQIWAALAGLFPDTRGLDLCREHCLTCGIVMYPETVLQASYMLQFTDEFDDLPIHAVATYGLSAWPELTHLYAIAEARYHRPDQALEAVHKQLPAVIHSANPYCSPTYYAEKYLFPYNDFWQCTWGGDPTFVETLLEGFCGVQADLNSLKIRPALPKSWQGAKPIRVAFIWRGSRLELSISAESIDDNPVIYVDGQPVKNGEIPAESVQPGGIHKITVGAHS